ncbi:unnamed protein product, partial [Meganyctiphanes norvegica]
TQFDSVSATSMGMWTSLALLSVAAVSTLSFPHPGPPIPEVGAGTRAQFYVLKPDGTFTYGYDTGNGLHETATKLESGDIEGEFGYKNVDGEDILLQYTAGEGGFVPRGNFLPQPVEVSASSQGSLSQYSDPARAAPAPAAPFEIAEIRGGIPGADGSYHFSYDTSSSSRTETADADLNIVGRYSFIADDGVSRSVDYKAGSATGFVAEGDHLPKVSDGDFAVRAAPQASASAPSIAYSAPSASSVNVVATKSSIPSAPRSDASYSFSYDAGDSARSESADADLNVVGSYSFTADDGVSRSVNYQAGSATGFMAEGDHLPKPVDALAGAGSAAFGNAPAATSYQAPVATSYQAPVASHLASPVAFEEAVIRGGVPGPDGSYQFSYDTSSSSRTESADALNSVTGSFGFEADDGVHRSIQYTAGAETGFIAEGAHLPVGPAVPGAESGIPTGRILPILSEDEANALAAATSGTSSSSPSLSYAAPSAPSPALTKSSSPVGSASDASYSFSYNADDSSRSESSDADLNVIGSYSFTADDGISRSVNYKAGSATGFIAEGDHLPKPVVADADTYTVSGAGSSSFSNSSPSAPAPTVAVVTKSSSPVAAASDASYSFSYNAGDSSRTESADSDLNIVGSYSFTADDGVSRSVNYKAGTATGFIAEGDHLPNPAVADNESSPAASYSAPATSYTASASPSTSSGFDDALIRSSFGDDGSYSFSYETDSSSRSETSDADLNIVGSYSFTADDGISRLVNYQAGSATGFVAEGDHLPAVDDTGASALSVKSSHVAAGSNSLGVYDYSAPSVAGASVITKSSTPFEEAQIRSTSNGDGSYSFSYDTSSSSRSESADASNSVTGNFGFVADDGIHRSIEYTAGAETGFIADGAHLPVGPAVPGAESGIPTGRILPILSEEEANALAGASTLLRSASSDEDDATPSDASYSFSFASDSYSRNEEADVDGNVKGSYTYVGDDGITRTVNFVAGRETGFEPEGEYTEAAGSLVSSASHSAHSSASSSVSSTSYQAPAAPVVPAMYYSEPSHSSHVATKSSAPPTASGNALEGIIIGDVNLVHANAEASPTMFGYSYTAI